MTELHWGVKVQEAFMAAVLIGPHHQNNNNNNRQTQLIYMHNKILL
jgi:hypothetical protein